MMRGIKSKAGFRSVSEIEDPYVGFWLSKGKCQALAIARKPHGAVIATALGNVAQVVAVPVHPQQIDAQDGGPRGVEQHTVIAGAKRGAPHAGVVLDIVRDWHRVPRERGGGRIELLRYQGGLSVIQQIPG